MLLESRPDELARKPNFLNAAFLWDIQIILARQHVFHTDAFASISSV
jgi:hypothetical protein